MVDEARSMAPTVLLVEDDDAVRGVIVRYLRSHGFDVVAAASAEEALDLAPARAFDIVVTDVLLPGLDGFAMAAELARRTPEVSVHFISGHFDAAMAIAAGLSPGTTVLRKPFPLAALLELLPSVVAERVESTAFPSSQAATHAASFVSRQPILDSSGRAFGYELLHRAKDGGTEDGSGAKGLTAVVLDMGLDTLTEGKPAFLYFNRDLLLSGAGTLLPSAKSVIQLRRGIEVDDEVVAACQRLHEAGYRLALDFSSDPEVERLLPFVRFVKIDVRSLSPSASAALAKRLSANGVRAIAENVETIAAFNAAKQAGFTLFQGYYSCHPTTLQASVLPGRRLVYSQLLSALRQPDVSVMQVEDLIKHDVSLSYRVLKCVNAAAYGQRSEVTSIQQALVIVGIDQIRKWVSVWSIAGLDTDAPSAPATVSLLRARCCELLGGQLSPRAENSELFLLGLCSLLGSILDRPLADAIADLPLASEIKAALLGEANTARAVLDVVVAYETGDWDMAEEKAQLLGLPDDAPAMAYVDALIWARQLSRGQAEGRVDRTIDAALCPL